MGARENRSLGENKQGGLGENCLLNARIHLTGTPALEVICQREGSTACVDESRAEKKRVFFKQEGYTRRNRGDYVTITRDTG